MILTVSAFTVGVIGFLFGLRCALELKKYVTECREARIAIAYKGKVKIHAPLQEWLLWYRLAKKDKQSPGGRVVYQSGGTRIALTTPVKNEKGRRVVRKGGARTTQGTWSATDETARQ